MAYLHPGTILDLLIHLLRGQIPIEFGDHAKTHKLVVSDVVSIFFRKDVFVKPVAASMMDR
jgi:hypothetical protein